MNDDARGQGPDLVVAIGAKPDKGAAMGQQDCVPVSALQMPDETEQMQAPEIGDKVQYVVEGTVEKIDGDNAYVQRESINGQPVGGPSDDQNPVNPGPQSDSGNDADNGAGPGQDGYSQLQQMAQGMNLQ